MAQDHRCTTDVTLLARLRDDPRDQAAWSEFVARYGPKVHGWCRRWRLQEADAEDVTQDVLLKLNARMASFAYDAKGSFRAWLKTLVHHAWRDLVEERRKAGTATGESGINTFLNSLEASDGLVDELQEEFHRELMDRAIQRVRPRVSSRAWEAFRLTALEGWSGAAAATYLQWKIAQVYLAKSRVTKRICEEVRKLEGGQHRAR
jgi:RNA polymerase sigma-70 factor (ECF subfamily)